MLLWSGYLVEAWQVECIEIPCYRKIKVGRFFDESRLIND